MTITFVAVGKKYIDILNDFFLKNESFGANCVVLTDKPEMFKNIRTVKYVNKIFSYFDKLLFSLRIVEEYRDDVLYLDVDELCYHDIFYIIKKIEFKERCVLYLKNWPINNLSKLDNERWGLFKDMVKTNHIEIETLFENFFYFPKTIPSPKLIYDLETLKPIFETMSIINENIDSEIGSGEGLALSYLLKTNNICFKQLKLD